MEQVYVVGVGMTPYEQDKGRPQAWGVHILKLSFVGLPTFTIL